MKKRFVLFLLVIVMSFTLVLSSCAKKEDAEDVAASVTDKKDPEEEKEAESDIKEESESEEQKPTEDNPVPEVENEPEEEKRPETESKPTDSGECAHEWGEWETKRKSTCVFEGEATRSCSKCNDTEKKNLPKSEKHNEVVDSAVEATCAREGKTEGIHCGYCYAVIKEQQSIPKKEHSFKNGYSCDCGDFVESAKFVVLSQNVRCADDGENKMIKDRAPRLKQLVEKYQPDLIGTQETTPTWNNIFKENLKEYGMIGCSREGQTAKSGEWNTILYRLDRFEVIESNTFWLSDTPEKVSRVTGSKCNRICTWALLKDKSTGKTFVFANTHLDHGTDEVREQQMRILYNELSDLIDKHPLILTGDFNAKPNSAVYAAATENLLDARTDAIEDRSLINYTFDSYGTGTGKIIDYCFYNDKASATWYKVANDQFGGYVSDHYGILSQFGIK